MKKLSVLALSEQRRAGRVRKHQDVITALIHKSCQQGFWRGREQVKGLVGGRRAKEIERRMEQGLGAGCSSELLADLTCE